MFLKNMAGRNVVAKVIYSSWNGKVLLAFMMWYVLFWLCATSAFWIVKMRMYKKYFQFIHFFTLTAKNLSFSIEIIVFTHCGKTKELRDVRCCEVLKNTYVWHVVEFMSNFGVPSQSNTSPFSMCDCVVCCG